MRGASLRHTGKARTNLNAFDGIETHHGVGNVGIQAVINRLTQSNRHTAGHDANACAAGVARFA